MIRKVLGTLVVLSLVIGGGTILQAMGGKPKKEVMQTEKTKVKKDVKTAKLSKVEDPVQQLFEEGNEYGKKGKLDEAIAKYRELVNNYPNSSLAPIALRLISTAYVYKEDLQKAIIIEKEIIAKYPKTPESLNSYLLIAIAYRDLKDYKNGIEWFQKSIKKYTEKGKSTAEALHGLAECYYYNKDYNSAIVTFQRIINEYPDAPYVKGYGVKYWIGCCYQQQGRFDEAIEIFKFVLERGDPKIFIHPDLITYYIGEMYKSKKDYKNAKIWYQKIINEYPKSDLGYEAEEKLKELINK